MGRPVPGAELSLDPPGCSVREARRIAADGVGRALFTGLGEGPHRLQATAQGYPPLETSILLRSGERKALEVALRSVGDLRITVRSAQGQPAAAVLVEAEESPTHASARAWAEAGFVEARPSNFQTDAQGILTLSGLPAGEYSVRAPGAGKTAQGRIQVEAEKTATLEIWLP